VSDTGRGIPELIRSQLFEPFVSHGKENGTGLGLTVVQKIVQDHGGDVAVEKTSPAGTVFRLLLPLSASQESVSERREEGQARTRLSRTEKSQPE
jgi:nitrogen-specific signal transduction histidine kinase